MSSKNQPTDLQALRHPLFWGALAVLLLNDHLLKGSGLLPGWLTGKLSDFAGLIVAPLVLSVALRARTTRGRALAFVAVGGWFAAANLFAPVAAATSAAAELVGLSWTFWVDPTDLVALAVLPLAWQLHASGTRARTRRVEGLALGLGLAACVASPTPEPTWQTAAVLFNDTGRTVEVRVRYVDVSVDCVELRDRFAEALPREVFGTGTTFIVAPNETLPLDRGLADGTAPDPFGRDIGIDAGGLGDGVVVHEGSCDVAMLSADGLPDTVVYWSGLGVRPVLVTIDSEEDRAGLGQAITLRRGDDVESLELGPAAGYSFADPVDIYRGGDACAEYGDVSGFAWSGVRGGRHLLTGVRPTIDGCVAVAFEDLDARDRGRVETFEGFICVPPEDFPFLPNSVLTVRVEPTRLHIERVEEIGGERWRTGELAIYRGVPYLEEGPFRVRPASVDEDCVGLRMECGGFRVPVAGGVVSYAEGPPSTLFVHPGQALERTETSGGRRARLRMGRAETMLATRASCGEGRDALGDRLDALVVYGEDPR